MPLYEALAVAAAFSVALVSMIVAELHGRLHIVTLTKWQTITATIVTTGAAAAVGGWASVQEWHVPYMLGSGFFGTTLANTAFMIAIFSLGARSATLLFSLNAPLALLLGYLFLGESIRALQGLGIALVVAGIVLAVLFGSGRLTKETLLARPAGGGAGALALGLGWGIAFGVGSAFCQAVGNLLARPAMSGGIDPFAAMAIRSACAAACFTLASLLPISALKPKDRPSLKLLVIGAGGAGTVMGIAMTFLMAALAGGKVGIVSTLASLTPVMVLPMVWARTGRAPPLRAWTGALLAVAGIACIAFG
ncbi:MAG: EamA family transporter [Parvibaculaceae bacterium]